MPLILLYHHYHRIGRSFIKFNYSKNSKLLQSNKYFIKYNNNYNLSKSICTNSSWNSSIICSINHNNNHSTNNVAVAIQQTTIKINPILRTFSSKTNTEPSSNKKLFKEGMKETSKIKENDSSSSSSSSTQQMSTKDKLKQAVKDYGVTVIGFHITISLCSLGFCYALVSSGLDLIGILRNIGISETLLQSRTAEGASNFLVAYAIHKVFAPARIAITLTAAPIIVNRLRKLGYLKKVVSKSNK